jgi:hypothetical protein
MLVVKPNPRRMQYMRDSPSENGSMRRRRLVYRLGWERVLLAAGITGVVVIGLIALAAHY